MTRTGRRGSLMNECIYASRGARCNGPFCAFCKAERAA